MDVDADALTTVKECQFLTHATQQALSRSRPYSITSSARASSDAGTVTAKESNVSYLTGSI
jgi:hypothetical protein